MRSKGYLPRINDLLLDNQLRPTANPPPSTKRYPACLAHVVSSMFFSVVANRRQPNPHSIGGWGGRTMPASTTQAAEVAGQRMCSTERGTRVLHHLYWHTGYQVGTTVTFLLMSNNGWVIGCQLADDTLSHRLAITWLVLHLTPRVFWWNLSCRFSGSHPQWEVLTFSGPLTCITRLSYLRCIRVVRPQKRDCSPKRVN